MAMVTRQQAVGFHLVSFTYSKRYRSSVKSLSSTMPDVSYERQGSSDEVRLILSDYSNDTYLIDVNLYVDADCAIIPMHCTDIM